MVSQRNVLVTGGAGFIGSRLVEKLLELGHRVIVVDDLSTGRLQNLHKEATFYHTSITSPTLDEIIQRENPDIIHHLAGQSSLSDSVKDPRKDAEINIQGSVRLIDAARRYGVGKLIYVSAADVYGETQGQACREDDPISPISPYGLSKYVVEEYLRLYHQLHRFDYRVLRYSSVYGTCQDLRTAKGVVASFAAAMLEGKQPRIFGTGEHERDFVYMDDVVQANILAMEEGTVGAYNIGTGVSVSVNQVFDLLKGILGYKWGPQHAPARLGEITRISLDCSKAERELGWRPTVSLQDGIHLTVKDRIPRRHARSAA